MMPSFLTNDDLGAHGSVFIPDERVEAEIGLNLDTLARDPDGPLILLIGNVRAVERADLVRFKKLLRLRARHKRLFGTELDDVPPFLRRDYRPPDAHRDQFAAELDAAIARRDTVTAAPEPAPVSERQPEPTTP
jgi:hypothetical protein